MAQTLSLILTWTLMLSLGAACGTKKPAVTDDALKDPMKNIQTHANFTSNCQDCHEANRPAELVDTVKTPHGFGRDCAECHSYPVWTKLATKVAAHSPYPTTCLGCHSVQLESASHGPQGDCKLCHTFPDWSVPGGR